MIPLELSVIGPGFCQDGEWYFANRSGLHSMQLIERLAPYGFMPLEESQAGNTPDSETLLSAFLFDIEPERHLQAEWIVLNKRFGELFVSAWSEKGILSEQRIKPTQIKCSQGTLQVDMPGDWRYAFGSPGHASFKLELTLKANGALELRSLYRSWTALFLTIPVLGTSEREVHFSAVEKPMAIVLPAQNLATGRNDCRDVAGHYAPVGSYLRIPKNRNNTEFRSISIQELLPFATAVTEFGSDAVLPELKVEFQSAETIIFTVHRPGEISLVSRFDATTYRCDEGELEISMTGNFDPAATFWLAGIAYGRVQLRLWLDDFGSLMVEVRELTDGTVMVLLPIHHRESTWFRFVGLGNEAS